MPLSEEERRNRRAIFGVAALFGLLALGFGLGRVPLKGAPSDPPGTAVSRVALLVAIASWALGGAVGWPVDEEALKKANAQAAARQASRPKVKGAPPDYVPAIPDDRTAASDPVRIRVSRKKLDALGVGECLGRALTTQDLDTIQSILWRGDSRAALVTSVRPFRVAAYTDELDAVAILESPPDVRRGFSVGDRLLTVNVYAREHPPESEPDLVPGARAYDRFVNFMPHIAELYSDEREKIDARKAAISEDEWRRCAELAQAYPEQKGDRARCGRWPCCRGSLARGKKLHWRT